MYIKSRWISGIILLIRMIQGSSDSLGYYHEEPFSCINPILYGYLPFQKRRSSILHNAKMNGEI
ncbi:hypothetical protein BACSP_00577 [Bacillus sp. T2.9-1]|nr:hypothetical protein BACSP_00577 [Bacillus sp. T2.9-1]